MVYIFPGLKDNRPAFLNFKVWSCSDMETKIINRQHDPFILLWHFLSLALRLEHINILAYYQFQPQSLKIVSELYWHTTEFYLNSTRKQLVEELDILTFSPFVISTEIRISLIYVSINIKNSKCSLTVKTGNIILVQPPS